MVVGGFLAAPSKKYNYFFGPILGEIRQGQP
jgi:hypothetical protein